MHADPHQPEHTISPASTGRADLPPDPTPGTGAGQADHADGVRLRLIDAEGNASAIDDEREDSPVQCPRIDQGIEGFGLADEPLSARWVRGACAVVTLMTYCSDRYVEHLADSLHAQLQAKARQDGHDQSGGAS